MLVKLEDHQLNITSDVTENENIVTITGNDKDLILCDEHSYIEKIYNDDTPFYCLEELGPDDREYYYDEDTGEWISEDEY